MGIASTGYKATVVSDAAGIPTGLAAIAPCGVVEAGLGGIMNIANDTVYTGAAKTAAALVPLAAAVMGTSYYVTGSVIPRNLRS